jgi:hypothetical protein
MASFASANSVAVRGRCVREEHLLCALTSSCVAYRGPSNRSAPGSPTAATCVVQLVRDMAGESVRDPGGLMKRRNNDLAIPVSRLRGKVIR